MKTFLILLSLVFNTIAFAGPTPQTKKLKGTYLLEVTMTDSGKTFKDLLTINEIDQDLNVKGTFTVPGVFSVPATGKVSIIRAFGNPHFLELTFTAKERGETFIVLLQSNATPINNNQFEKFYGKLVLKESNTKFAKFVAKKISRKM